MTLVLSAQRDRLLMLSDIVIAREGRHDAQVSGLPLTPRPIVVASGNHTLVGLAQKMVQFDERRVLLWAGSKVVAGHVCNEFAKAILTDPTARLLDFLAQSGLSEGDLSQTSFIYHRLDSDGRLFREAHNAKRSDIDGVDTFFSGTGDFHFIDDIRPMFDAAELNPDIAFMRNWVHRVAYAMLSEALDGENLQFAYGGWFEIALFADGALRKMPYLVKLWEERDGQVVSGPCISGWYKDAHLCLLRSDVKRAEADTTNDLTVVRDPLERTKVPDSRSEVADSYARAQLQIHLIFNARGRWGIVLKGFDTDDFQFEIARGKLNMRWHQRLRDELTATLQGPVGGQILRPFSDSE
ncbi:MAG: hypothetical protein HOP13_08210 [Alphaproteobacteria bacterium]|nr:hypothetical protein [Alphaproteobacteria bacterium]